MKMRLIVASICALLAVTACSHFDPIPLQGAPSFQEQLGKQYTALSVNDEPSSIEFLNQEYFAKKGERATAGVDVQPEDPVTWNVPREYRPEMNNAYDMLQIALVPDAKKVTAPIAAADAQAFFDCWVDQVHKQWPKANASQCRAAFYEAFCRMYGNDCKSILSDDIFRVYFDTNKYDVKTEGYNAVAQAAVEFGKKGKEVIIAGHADRVGSNDYNMALSKARADSVRQALIKAGVPNAVIVEKYFGESLPVVPTADNIPNANNRRVLIVVR
jgi:OmpA-OmpF porin, OOP family